jgi:hypothetical protein
MESAKRILAVASRHRIQVTEVEHRVAAEREFVENLTTIFSCRAEDPEDRHRQRISFEVVAFGIGQSRDLWLAHHLFEQLIRLDARLVAI